MAAEYKEIIEKENDPGLQKQAPADAYGPCGPPDELYQLMRECGHFLYHKAKAGQGRILNILEERKEISQKELQELLQVQPGSLSEILSKIEKKGLLERVADAGDRRKVVVRITAAGEERVLERRRSGKRKDWFAVLDEGQKEELKQLLKQLLDSWQNAAM